MSYPSQVLMSDVPLFMTQGYIMNVIQKLGHHPVRATISKDKKASDKAVCIIQFANIDAAREAVSQLNGKSVSISGSGSTSTTFKLTQGTHNDQKLYNVFVGDLAPDIDDFRLFKFFGDRFKTLCDAKVIVNEEGKSRGFGFLAFTSEDDQKFCIKIMDGSLDLGNRAIKVSPAIPGPVNHFPVDVYALRIMSGDPWCRYTSWNQFIEPAEYPFISVKVNLTAFKDIKDSKDDKENKDRKDVKGATNSSDDHDLVKYNVTSNTDYLNHEILERDCHLWDALECTKWLPLMALNMPPSDYLDPPAELDARATARKQETNRNLSNGTDGDDVNDVSSCDDKNSKGSKKSNVPTKLSTSKPSKIVKKTNGIASSENCVEDLSDIIMPDEVDRTEGKKSADTLANCNNVDEVQAKNGFDSIVYEKSLTNPEDLSDLFPSNILPASVASELKNLSQDMFWHVKLGHIPTAPLKVLSKFNERIKDVAFDNVAEECEVCKLAKVPDRSAKRIRELAKKPLESIHLHVIGPVQPVSKADGKRYIAVFMDEYSRVAMAYILKHKSEIGDKFESFLKNARKEIGRGVDVRYVRMYDKMDFSGEHMKTVLDRESALLQQTPVEIPALAKDFAKVLQEKVRSMMFDSRLPKKMWDLAVATAIHTYNRTPLDSIGFEIPYKRFSPKMNSELHNFHRFGCVAYVKLSKKSQHSVASNKKSEEILGETPAPLDDVPGETSVLDDAPPGDEAKLDEDEQNVNEDGAGPKARKGLRCIFVGYTSSAYLLFHPESSLFTETNRIRCNEKLVYGDVYTKSPVKDVVVESIDADWFKSLSMDEESSSRRDDYYKSTSSSSSSSSSKRRRFH